MRFARQKKNLWRFRSRPAAWSLRNPAVTLRAKVSAISEDPVDSSAGALYQVTLVVDDPGGTALSGAAMHARMLRSPR